MKLLSRFFIHTISRHKNRLSTSNLNKLWLDRDERDDGDWSDSNDSWSHGLSAWLDDDTSHSDDVGDGTRGDGCDDQRASMQLLFVTMVSWCSRQEMELKMTSLVSSMAVVGGVDSTVDEDDDVDGVSWVPHVDVSNDVDGDTMMRCEFDQWPSRWSEQTMSMVTCYCCLSRSHYCYCCCTSSHAGDAMAASDVHLCQCSKSSTLRRHSHTDELATFHRPNCREPGETKRKRFDMSNGKLKMFGNWLTVEIDLFDRD